MLTEPKPIQVRDGLVVMVAKVFAKWSAVFLTPAGGRDANSYATIVRMAREHRNDHITDGLVISKVHVLVKR